MNEMWIIRFLWWVVVRVKLIYTRGKTKMAEKDMAPRSQVSKQCEGKGFVSPSWGGAWLFVEIYICWTLSEYEFIFLLKYFLYFFPFSSNRSKTNAVLIPSFRLFLSTPYIIVMFSIGVFGVYYSYDVDAFYIFTSDLTTTATYLRLFKHWVFYVILKTYSQFYLQQTSCWFI